MKIFYRDCIKDFVLEAQNGDKLELVKDQEYVTSSIKDGKVTVFTRYWVKVPADIFNGEREEPRKEKLVKVTTLTDFRQRLEILINCTSMENGSNTPDYVLAEYLTNCLQAFDLAVRQREIHKGV